MAHPIHLVVPAWVAASLLAGAGLGGLGAYALVRLYVVGVGRLLGDPGHGPARPKVDAAPEIERDAA